MQVDLFRVQAEIFCLDVTRMTYDHIEQNNSRFRAGNSIGRTCRQPVTMSTNKLHGREG